MSQGTSAELALIDAFLRPFGQRRDRAARAAAGVLVGPGDDCAVLAPSRGMRLVATTDAVVEGVHFDFATGTPADAGHKALAVNLSDLAAAGARPRWFLCALGVPRGAPGALRIAAGLARGMAALARAHAVALAGGNVTSALQWSVTITALGEAKRPLSRAGGKPGDALVVCGELGKAALGLSELRRGLRTSMARAQLRPEPLVKAGLAAAGLASAAIDVSDGLLQDLGHLAAASGCGARLDCASLPEPRPVKAASPDHALALAGGEDYALLLAVRPERLSKLLAALRATAAKATPIGELVRRRGIALFDGDRARALPARRGWDHLGRDGGPET